MRIDFRSREWPATDSRPDWARPEVSQWSFFAKPPSDIETLIRIYSKENSADFPSADQAITDLMVRKVLREERLKRRLRFCRLLWAAFKRKATVFYIKHLYARYALLLARLERVASKEEVAQKPSEDKDSADGLRS